MHRLVVEAAVWRMAGAEQQAPSVACAFSDSMSNRSINVARAAIRYARLRGGSNGKERACEVAGRRHARLVHISTFSFDTESTFTGQLEAIALDTFRDALDGVGGYK